MDARMSPSLNSLFLAVALAAVVIKLASTAYLVRHTAQARQALDSRTRRWAYSASKLSPLLLFSSLLLQALLAGDRHNAGWYAALLLTSAGLAALVVHLRRKGRWYGVAHSVFKAIRKHGGR